MAEKLVNSFSGPSGFRAKTAQTSSYTNDSVEAPLCVPVFIFEVKTWRVN